MTRFTYLPLCKERLEIRLLKVIHQSAPPKGAQDAAPALTKKEEEPALRFTIQHASLVDSPDYTALSYTWGDPRDTVGFNIQDTEIRITRNLANVLQCLSQDPDIEYLWIDALCINQGDNEEKSWQVEQMRQIYAKAAQVICWIGPADKEAEDIMLKLCLLADSVRQRSIENSTISDKLKYIAAQLFLNDISTNHGPSSQYRTLDRVLQQPYWRRIWIIQEYVLGTGIQFGCGSVRVPLETFEAAIISLVLAHMHSMSANMGAVDANVPGVFQAAVSCYRFLQKKADNTENRKPLFQLLVQASGFDSDIVEPWHATDPRDYVYALLGLSADAESLGIVPNYSKSWEYIYTETARVLIHAGHPVLLFGGIPSSPDQLPSWAPNWAKGWTGLTVQSIGNPRFEKERTFNAAKNIFAGYNKPHSNDSQAKAGEIEMRGVCVAQVRSAMCLEWPPSIDTFTVFKPAHLHKIKYWFQRVKSFVTTQSDELSLSTSDEIIWRVLRAPTARGVEEFIGKDTTADRPGAKWRDFFNAVYQIIISSDFSTSYSDSETLRRFIADVISQLEVDAVDCSIVRKRDESMDSFVLDVLKLFLWSIVEKSRNRSVVVTSEGHVGLAPGMVQKNDFVTILASHPTPLVLRQCEDGRFRLLGDAYVEGIMQGEVAGKEEELESFILK